MTGRTNFTSTPPAFDPQTHIDAVCTHFDALVGESKANAAALPATGNWVGRSITTVDTGSLYLCVALPNTWQLVFRDTGWVNPPAFNTGWSNHDAGFDPVQIRIRGGFLVISGRVDKTAAAGQVIFTLPAPYRPSRLALITVPHDTGSGGLWVGADGRVELLGSAGVVVTSLGLNLPPLPIA